MTQPHFRQCDVTRLLKAVAKAGESVRKIEISPDGRIEVYLGGANLPENTNEWDAVLEHETQSAP